MAKVASGCTVYPVVGEPRCGMTPAVAVIVGCIHEHVYRAAVCASHEDTKAWCHECLRGADPHKCGLLVQRVRGPVYSQGRGVQDR